MRSPRLKQNTDAAFIGVCFRPLVQKSLPMGCPNRAQRVNPYWLDASVTPVKELLHFCPFARIKPMLGAQRRRWMCQLRTEALEKVRSARTKERNVVKEREREKHQCSSKSQVVCDRWPLNVFIMAGLDWTHCPRVLKGAVGKKSWSCTVSYLKFYCICIYSTYSISCIYSTHSISCIYSTYSIPCIYSTYSISCIYSTYKF